MRDLGSDINIREVIEDKTSEFCIKKFRIGNTNFERPEKTLDASHLSRDVFNSIKDNFKFREGTKVIGSFNTLSNLYYQYEDSQIRQYFFKKTWVDIPSVMNYTLNFNPFINGRYTSEMRGFLDRYYVFSDLILTVPNIRTEKKITRKTPEGKEKREKKTIISKEDYIRFVDTSYEYLDRKNSKPIFVPISLRMKLGEMKELVEYYLKKEYFYYWVDFDMKSINENRISDLRHISNLIRESGYFDKTVFYFTNLKREIRINAKDNLSEASDVLSSLTGASLIGVNRESGYKPSPTPTPEPNQSPIYEELDPVPPNYKSRLLDISSYYYVKTSDPNFIEKRNYVPANALRINSEFGNQTDHFFAELSMRDYLREKRMLTSYHDGGLLRELISRQPSLSKFIDFWKP